MCVTNAQKNLETSIALYRNSAGCGSADMTASAVQCVHVYTNLIHSCMHWSDPLPLPGTSEMPNLAASVE